MAVSQGLRLDDYEELLSKEERDEALIRRKLMTAEKLREGAFEPYEAAPSSAEENAYEDGLVWKLNPDLTGQVGDAWGRATLYVVPEPPSSSWARTLLHTSAEEVRAALEGQTDAES